MRRLFAFLAVGSLLFAACAEDNPTIGATGATTTGGTGATAPATAADCAAANEGALFAPGTLTVATGNPAFEPWFSGGEIEGSEFEFNDPATGEGYESAVVYAVAERLGFSDDDVTWVPVTFNKSIAPGPKDFDFNLQQVSYTPKRDDAVDFSESYYEVNQALLSYQGSPVDGATSIADLEDAVLGAPIGTTSLAIIEDVVQPNAEPQVYDDLAGAIQDLSNKTIDGVVLDLPSAFIAAAIQVPKGVVVGQFPTEGEQEYFGMVFAPGNPLVECVNLALDELKADGTLDALEQQWLADKTNAPVLT